MDDHRFSPAGAPDANFNFGRLEKPYHDDYRAWKETPNPQTTGKLLKTIQPAIDRGISANIGPSASPVLKSSARRLALEAVENYDPSQAKLNTHVINHLKGLRRIARNQNQVLKVPERVALDQSYLSRAEEELSDRLGREPTDSEIADHTGLSLKRLAYVRGYANPVAEGSLLAQMTSDEGGSLPAVMQGGTDTVLEAVYTDLDSQNKKIMEWTLGMHNRQPLSNAQIASKLGITPGAVSQRKAVIQSRIDEMEEFGVF